MALTVISANYPPHIDPSKTPLAYGGRALPRLVGNLFLKAPFIISIIIHFSYLSLASEKTVLVSIHDGKVPDEEVSSVMFGDSAESVVAQW